MMQTDRGQITAEYLLSALQTKVGMGVITALCGVGFLGLGIGMYMMTPQWIHFPWWVWLLVPVGFILSVISTAFFVGMICFVALSVWIEARGRSWRYRIIATTVAIVMALLVMGSMFNSGD